MFFPLILLFSLFSSLQASTPVFNEAKFTDANWRLEVKQSTANSLQVCIQEGSEMLLDQTVTIGQLRSYHTPTCTLIPDGTGFQLSYVGLDGTSLKAHIDAEATIDVLPNGSGVINTGFSHRKSWGFKTPGVWRNNKRNLMAFYNLITEAKTFHNLGVLQVKTGHFVQDHYFNKGVFHLGVALAQVGVHAYAPYAEYLLSQSSPHFQPGKVDNYGVILAEQGLG